MVIGASATDKSKGIAVLAPITVFLDPHQHARQQVLLKLQLTHIVSVHFYHKGKH